MKMILTQICLLLLCLLFVYTSASKFLDNDKFVFQMRLAPVPLMKIAAPVLGWLVPAVEFTLSIVLAVGMFVPSIKIKALKASAFLLVAFEIYIIIMLLSGSHLPCTCGGIISTMGWKQHLFFNAFFILAAYFSIKYLKKHKTSPATEHGGDTYKILSRA
ncbi:MAG: MauE/DoxX family redox-associated membrane protein [Bacteroidota bacterium]